MAQKDQRTSSTPGMPNMAEFAETGRKQVEAILDMQKKFFDPQEMSRDWSARAKAEADLATAFAEKLSAAKSMPEVAGACQDWMSRRMELFTEDSRRLFADGQKFMNATTQMLSGGWKGGSS
jgi:Phasin protein